MIIQIRGTSGSGKSTVMRTVMEHFPSGFQAMRREGRKQPLYYVSLGERIVTVLGHYETQCGGCDTIGSARAVYDLISELPEAFQRTILCEGLLLSEDVKWSSQLPNLRVIFLTTPLDRCLKQIEGRRHEAGNEKPLNPDNTSNRVQTIERARLKLEAKGVLCRRCPPEQAHEVIMKWIASTSMCSASSC